MASVLEPEAATVVYVVEGPPSVGVSDGLSDGLADGEAQGDSEGVADGLSLGVVLGVALELGVVLGVALSLGEVLGVALSLGEVLGVALELGEVLGVALSLGEVLGVALSDGVVLLDGVALLDALGDGHGDVDGDVDGEADGDPLELADALGVGLSAASARASSRWAAGSACSLTVMSSETGLSEPEVTSGTRAFAASSVNVAVIPVQLTDRDPTCGRGGPSLATSVTASDVPVGSRVRAPEAAAATVAWSTDLSPSTRIRGAATDTVRCATVRVTEPV
nr:hypothetical protein [Planotetraspora phitsanulokensis]